MHSHISIFSPHSSGNILKKRTIRPKRSGDNDRGNTEEKKYRESDEENVSNKARNERKREED